MSRGDRKTRLARKRLRHKKLHKLRQKYLATQNEDEKKEILEKLIKIAPALTKDEFLTTIPKKEEG